MNIILFSIQHLCIILQTTILTTLLININPSTIFICNGLLTLIYLLLSKNKTPIFLTYNIFFLPYIIFFIQNNYKYENIIYGFIISSIILYLIGHIIKYYGIKWINLIFPAYLSGSWLILIGIKLIKFSFKISNCYINNNINITNTLLFLFTLLNIILINFLYKKFISIISILLSIIISYIVSIYLKIINIKHINTISWFKLPILSLHTYSINIESIFFIIPIIFLILIEHINHFTILFKFTKNWNKELQEFIKTNSIIIFLSSFLGYIPISICSENVKTFLINKKKRKYKNNKIYINYITSIITILLSFLNKFIFIIQSIPKPIVSACNIFIFGMLIISGIKIISENINLNNKNNILILLILIILGIINLNFQIFKLKLNNIFILSIINIIIIIFNLFKYILFLN